MATPTVVILPGGENKLAKESNIKGIEDILSKNPSVVQVASHVWKLKCNKAVKIVVLATVKDRELMPEQCGAILHTAPAATEHDPYSRGIVETVLKNSTKDTPMTSVGPTGLNKTKEFTAWINANPKSVVVLQPHQSRTLTKNMALKHGDEKFLVSQVVRVTSSRFNPGRTSLGFRVAVSNFTDCAEFYHFARLYMAESRPEALKALDAIPIRMFKDHSVLSVQNFMKTFLAYPKFKTTSVEKYVGQAFVQWGQTKFAGFDLDLIKTHDDVELFLQNVLLEMEIIHRKLFVLAVLRKFPQCDLSTLKVVSLYNKTGVNTESKDDKLNPLHVALFKDLMWEVTKFAGHPLTPIYDGAAANNIMDRWSPDDGYLFAVFDPESSKDIDDKYAIDYIVEYLRKKSMEAMELDDVSLMF